MTGISSTYDQLQHGTVNISTRPYSHISLASNVLDNIKRHLEAVTPQHMQLEAWLH